MILGYHYYCCMNMTSVCDDLLHALNSGSINTCVFSGKLKAFKYLKWGDFCLEKSAFVIQKSCKLFKSFYSFVTQVNVNLSAPNILHIGTRKQLYNISLLKCNQHITILVLTIEHDLTFIYVVRSPQ